MLRRFFSIHHGNVIHRHDEYRRLLQLAMAAQDRAELLSDDYFVDLALWFNLAWLDPDDIASDARMLALQESGRGYTREDVRYVIGRQRLMASGVPHLYHRLEHDGQIELLTVPYYHPILPLIIDNRSALRADPTAIIPDPPFAYPDDAAFQLEEAIASLRRTLYLDQQFALAHFALANLRRRQGLQQESEKHFRNALAVLGHYRPDDILPESDGITAGRLAEIIRSTASAEERA